MCYKVQVSRYLLLVQAFSLKIIRLITSSDDPDDDEGTDTSEDLETDTYYSCTEGSIFTKYLLHGISSY